MQLQSAEKRLAQLVQTPGFRKIREILNLLMGDPVWWYCVGADSPIHILESHNKTGCGLLHDDPRIREEWADATYGSIRQAEQDRVALMTSDPPDHIQVVTPILCGEEPIGFVGLAYLVPSEQRRLYPFLPLLTEHLQQIAERERATDDLNAIKRLWKEVVSTLDSEVLQMRILEEVMTVLDAYVGVLMLVDNEHRLTLAATVGFGEQAREMADFHLPSTPYENKVFAWAQAAQMLSEGDPLGQWFLGQIPESPGSRGVWAIPLVLSGKLLGLVLCPGREGVALLPHLDAALETLALGSSVAIRNSIDFEHLRQKAAALGTVHSVYRLVSTTRMVGDLLNRSSILNRMAKLILQVLNVRKCSIMLVDEAGVLQPCVQLGLIDGEIGTRPLQIGEGIPGRAAAESTSLLIDSPRTDARFRDDPTAFYASSNYLSVPMFEAEVIGVMTVSDRVGYPARFTEGDREVLHTMAEQAVIALLNIDFFEKQERIALQTMGVFDNLFETGDPDQSGQAHKLADFVRNYAKFLKIDAQTRQLFQMAAFIQGIARVRAENETTADPESNLQDPPDTTDVAVRMARLLDLPENVITILRDHQENFDGSGSPRGLRGEEIPMGARLLAIAAEYQSLVNPAAGGEAASTGEALGQMSVGSGIRFDPNLLESLSSFLESDEYHGR